MGVRDDEIQRLTWYAKGLGVKLSIIPYVPRSHVGGGWTTDGTEITIYYRKNESKINIILKIVHELAHHIAWTHSGRTVDLATNQALFNEDENDGDIPKEQRKLIYITERDDAQYREAIYNEIGLKIPMYIFKADIELDIWIYYRYYITGKYPSYKSILRKKKELRKKFHEANS